MKAKRKSIQQILKLLIVPHAKNDYRPHLIRRYGLLAVIFVFIGLQLGYNGARTGDVLGRESDITINALLQKTNTARKSEGLPGLALNSKLNQAAYLKAKDMYQNQYWSHISPTGVQPWKWFGDVDYNYSVAGENLAKNFSSTDAVMIAWLDSPTHKANILKPGYQDVGFAVVNGQLYGEQTSLIVALYAAPAEKAVAGSTFSESKAEKVAILTKLAVASRSLTIAVFVGLFVMVGTIGVAIMTHFHRHKLPAALQKSWYRHHGIIKSIGLGVFAIFVVFLYGGGQI